MNESTEVPEVTIQHTLVDVHDDESERRIAVEVSCNQDGVFLRIEGHGEKTALDGRGMPVLVELRGGEVWMSIWADVNQEDPTHDICLAGARESCRDDRPMFVQTVVPTCDGGTLTTFKPFAGKVGDRVLVGDSDFKDRYEGEIVALIPAQPGTNPLLVMVKEDDGRQDIVSSADIEEVYPKDA